MCSHAGRQAAALGQPCRPRRPDCLVRFRTRCLIILELCLALGWGGGVAVPAAIWPLTAFPPRPRSTHLG